MQTAHAFCLEGRMHRFNRSSGWCEQGCGVRDDGQQTTPAGALVASAPDSTPALFTDDRTEQ